jgi:putative ABC transport system permease protein
MLTSDLLSTAFAGLTTNKGRSSLTMLGIVIGVGAVVLMVSMGRSFERYILDQVESFGTNTIDVFPVGFEKFGRNVDSLSFGDAEAIASLTTIESATPVIVVAKPVAFGREQRSPLVLGTYAQIFKNYGLKLADGRLLDERDESGARFAAVLSHQTAEDLFGNRNPLNERVTIGGFSFTVVGTLEGLGSLLLQDLDTPVYVPFSTARAITGQTYLTYVTVRAKGDPALAKEDITSLLRQRHRIENPENDPDKDDFIARSAEQVTSIVSSVTLGLTLFLAIVAGISLLVGGIGIMNIMLVAVTERTREIGLRKAIGASRKDILRQFLLEAVTLTLTGGAVGLLGGIFFGWLLATIAAKFLGPFPFALSFSAIILAVSMAFGTGIVFGLYPARKAAALSPIEALRYE